MCLIEACNLRLIGARVTELEEVLETAYEELMFEPKTGVKWVSTSKSWRKRNPFRWTFDFYRT